MTVSSTTVKNSYSGNGSTSSFAYTFKILQDSDLVVIIRSSTGTETTKNLTSHYTVSGAGSSSGGSVTFTSGNIPASGETVVIRRNVPQTQSIDYIANDPFPAETHEEGLDRATLVAQQISEATDRSIKLSRTNTMTSTEFTVGATDRANKILAFDSNGEISVTQELGSFKGNWSSGTDYVGRDIVKDTSTNNIFLVNTAHTSSGSQPLTTNTNSAKYDLIVDAASATTSQTAAASSATAAASSQTAAASSATAAASSQTAAASSATSAATSASTATTKASEASTSATSAASSFDSFDDRYLGVKSSDPSTDNDGDALQTGALYFKTSDGLKVYNGSAWEDIKPTSAQQTNINTVAGQISPTNNIATVAGISNDVSTVAGIQANVTAVAGDATDIGTVATDLAGSNNVGAVASNITNINSVAGIAGDITSLANSLEKTYVVTVANVGGVNIFRLDGANNPTIEIIRGNEYIFDVSDSSVSGHPLRFLDGSGNSWTSGVTVVGTAGQSGAKVKFEVPSNAPNSMRYYCSTHGNAMGNTISVSDSAINTVASNITAINSNATNIAAITGVNSNATNINTVATANSNITTVASNISGVNSFGERYRVSANAPSTSLDSGDLWFDSSNNILKVYGASGFQAAGSSVNGTSDRFTYTISGTPTTVSGADDNGNSLSYDAGFIDVYLNGVKQVNGTDVTVTSGNSIVFASALAANDIVDCVAFGTFSVANINATNITSGTVANARLSSDVTQNTATQTLTNKTLTSPTITTPSITTPTLAGSSSSAGSILFKEDTDNGTNAVTLIGPASTADVTVTLPAATDTLVGKATTDTLTNKTLALGNNTVSGTTAQFNTALSDGSFATLAGSETLTNKTVNIASNTFTVDGTDAVGFRNTPVNSKSADYTLVLSDSGKTIYHPSSDNNTRTFTIPANSSVAYPIGTVITFINLAAANLSIAITSDTMNLAADGTTGTRTLAQYGVATAIKLENTNWFIGGVNLS